MSCSSLKAQATISAKVRSTSKRLWPRRSGCSAVADHVLRRSAQTIHAEFDDIAIRHVLRRLAAMADARRGASGNHIARQQAHELADVADQRRNVEDQIG